MSNLYFKNNAMGCLFKGGYSLKMLLLIFMLSFGFILSVFADNQVYFSPGNTYPILNHNSISTDLKISSDAGIKSYGVDLYDQSQGVGQKSPNDKLSVSTNVRMPNITNITNPDYGLNQPKNGYYVRTYAGFDANNAAPYTTFSDTSVGRLSVINSGSNYLTGVYVGFYTGTNDVTELSIVGGSGKEPYDSLSGLNIYFWASPAVEDTVEPIFPNNATTIDINTEFPNRQSNRQNKDDFAWTFDLLDNSNTSPGSNGWIATPDFDAGTNFRPNATYSVNSTITNQDGINSGSFVLQIYVATGWDNNTAQNAWTNWNAEYTYTNVHGDITLTGQDKTWRYFDKNYSGDITEANMSDFGVEELVMISGYVEDRNMGVPGGHDILDTWDDIKGYSYYETNNDTNFVYYINQGMRPWFNQDTEGTYTHDSTCKLDIVQSQSGFVIRTITGFLHDDWAGIDTGTVQVIVTGTRNDSIVSQTYYVTNSELSLNNFSFTDSGCRVDGTTTTACTPQTPNSCGNTVSVYPGNGVNEVCNDGSINTGGYQLVFGDMARSYDPEEEIYVSIVYKDSKGKDGRPVSCDWGVAKSPRFVGTGDRLDNWLTYLTSLMNLSNHPQGAQVSEINIQLQDDWAGVDTGTIVGAISGNELSVDLDDIVLANANLNYDSDIYSVKDSSSVWNFDNYPNVNVGYVKSLLNTTLYDTTYIDWLNANITSIQSFQNLNYQLDFVQTGANSNFDGYFAPEHNINLSLTFKDKSNTGLDVDNEINVIYENNEGVEFWDHTKIANFTGGTSQKLNGGDDDIGNYLTGEMAKLFSGNVASGENRIFPYDITGDNQSQLGVLKQTDIAFNVTDNWAGVDSGTITITITGNRRGEPYIYVFTASNLDFTAFSRGDSWANNLNYLAMLSNHDIYFDRQSRGGGAPVLGRESRYTIILSGADLKQPDGNLASVSFTRDMENLSCKNLDRCNSRLYFTYNYGSGVVPVVQTGVHPFLGQTLYVITTGSQVIYTGVNDNFIACNGAGSLGAPIDLEFEAGLLDGGDNSHDDYQSSELLVMDGNFELSGNTLILK